MERNICAVFDIDDTLYLERDYVQSGFEAVGRWAAKCIQAKDFAERCWSKFEAGRRNSIFDEVLLESGTQPTPQLVSTLVEVYRTHHPGITLAEDAYDALHEISRTASIAVVTDGPVVCQNRKIEALGLASLASPIVLTDVLGIAYRKPHPRAFEQVKRCRLAKVYLYIADNPIKDFAAPKCLGWITIRVRRPGGLHFAVEHPDVRPDYEMADCSRIPEILTNL